MSKVKTSSSSSTPRKIGSETDVQMSKMSKKCSLEDLPQSIRMTYLPGYINATPNLMSLNFNSEEPYDKLPHLTKASTPGDESDSSDSLKSGEMSISSTAINCDSDVSIPERASSELAHHPSWRLHAADNLYGDVENPKKRPSSVTFGQKRSGENKNRSFLKFFLTAKEKNTQNRTNQKRVAEPILEESVTVIDELHVHLYQANSVFLNELFLLWNRQLLRCTTDLDLKLSNSISDSPNIQITVVNGEHKGRSIDDILDLVVTMNVANFKFRKTRHQWLSTVNDFYQKLLDDARLQRACFQNSKFTAALLNLVERTALTLSSMTQEQARDAKYSTEVLSIYIILLDMFRILVQNNTGTGVLEEQGMSFSRKGDANWNMIMEKIVQMSMLTGTSFGEVVDDVICDPLRFGKMAWRNSPEAKIILLLVIKSNVAVALLHEILTLYMYTPGDHVSLPSRGDCRLNQFLKEVVTQVLGLLVGSKQSTMSASESVNLFHQVSVLWMMINNFHSTFTIKFLRSNYYEEFKYFVQEENLKLRIPNEYLIKPKVLSLFSNIRSEILKSSRSTSSTSTFPEKQFAKIQKDPIINY